jgi:hypothetical protein
MRGVHEVIVCDNCSLGNSDMQMNRLLAVAIDRGIAVIEDATQAISTELNARKAGNFGDFACSVSMARRPLRLRRGKRGGLTAKKSAIACSSFVIITGCRAEKCSGIPKLAPNTR